MYKKLSEENFDEKMLKARDEVMFALSSATNKISSKLWTNFGIKKEEATKIIREVLTTLVESFSKEV
jgi:hypothetical protein